MLILVAIGIKCEISPIDKRVLTTLDMLHATVSLALLLLHVLLANSLGTPCTKLTGCSNSRIPPPLLATAATSAETTVWADDPPQEHYNGALFAALLAALS